MTDEERVQMVALGEAVAAAVKKHHPQAVPQYLGAVVDSFTHPSVNPTWLTTRFAMGDTHFAGVFNGKPQLQRPRPYWPNVELLWARIQAGLEPETEGEQHGG